jgi:hypothetical protein
MLTAFLTLILACGASAKDKAPATLSTVTLDCELLVLRQPRDPMFPQMGHSMAARTPRTVSYTSKASALQILPSGSSAGARRCPRPRDIWAPWMRALCMVSSPPVCPMLILFLTQFGSECIPTTAINATALTSEDCLFGNASANSQRVVLCLQ